MTHDELRAMHESANPEVSPEPPPGITPPVVSAPKQPLPPDPVPSEGVNLLDALVDKRDLRGFRKREPPAPPPARSRSVLDALRDDRVLGYKRLRTATNAVTAMASTGAAASAAENMGAYAQSSF